MAKQEVSWYSSLGSFVAACLSWHLNHSVLWLILHLLFGWVYVLYALCRWYL